MSDWLELEDDIREESIVFAFVGLLVALSLAAGSQVR